MLTDNFKTRILSAITTARSGYPSDARHAKALGITPSVYSALKSGNIERQLSDAAWLSVARRLDVPLREEATWKAARTATFDFITAQLTACQASGLSAILVDEPNIGKTFTARHYCRTNANAIYIDCSQHKSKQRFVRAIAEAFGLSSTGRYTDVYADLVYYFGGIANPLVVLDEAGDLKADAFLELKALWNATERCCAWYMMGADGLKEKINRNIEYKKVGYTELFSRFGDRYSRVTPEDGREREHFKLQQAVAVATLNAPEGTDAIKLARATHGGLRRLYTEIEKLKTTNV